MLKLTGFDEVLAAAGNLYMLLALAGVCIALWKGKTWRGKCILSALVLTVFMAPLVPEIYRQMEYRNRLARAQSMFAERCKTAGEKIHRTVENVDGVYLMKIRPSEVNFGGQFMMDDPYGADLGGDAYVGSLLRGSYLAGRNIKTPAGYPPRVGYRYVEVSDTKDGQRYQYTGSVKVISQMKIDPENLQKALKIDPKYDINNYAFVLDKAPASGKPPRYGVTYDDISTHEEREYWIAGSSLKVIDLETNEVIGERIGYMMDWAQGSRAGQRSPWLYAANNACPDFFRNYQGLMAEQRQHASSAQDYQTLDFVEKVLKPSK